MWVARDFARVINNSNLSLTRNRSARVPHVTPNP